MERARRLRAIGFRRGRYQSKFVARLAPKTRHVRSIQPGMVWESLFMRKSRVEKRAIVQKPWEFPMAAQHLAAILIQKRVRGMLYRLHIHQDNQWRPPQLCRATSSRRHFASPMQRFIHSTNGTFDDDQGFRHYAATLIQAWYRKEQLRWRYTRQRFALYHIAALQIQYTWKTHYQRRLYRKHHPSRLGGASLSPRARAALTIQAAWKAYTNRRIYRYYRDLITFRNTGDPAMMLRAINPSEAGLLDAAMGAHVRFRLGGMSFPPTIYYKIFTRKAVCDLNAFSPKDYTLTRRTVPPTSHSKPSQPHQRLYIRVGQSYYRARQTAEEQDRQHWYKRIENNGWRPVTAKVLSEANHDPIAQATGQKAMDRFHYSRLVRKQDIETQRRLRKRQWMHKLYTHGLLTDISPEATSLLHRAHSQEVFDVDFENEQWEAEAEEMFQWVSALDYDAYLDDWHELGKTASTDDDTRLIQPLH
ncbi:hypothetical protein Poli38472_011924 [Pythium oligandrum]|uniref:IQ calmodulin-binding motif family protein n=1 Tax=Pythium oligandrum TaxID=41045 RepID=A0A8K1FDG7_PYTOL|nr:hypothetical protein Poli38472_011924 [Pythium oligandrum]|eukprot:TMW58336.1 hypothetical protein Poli38472_011924 [Pythium oligandrum]